ncbi:hypothetical protein SAMN04487846_0567 [Microbacterium sp. cf046]|nr:hypothetical protein SAMN04487846_0567 [Microbacterium sp. cf046]
MRIRRRRTRSDSKSLVSTASSSRSSRGRRASHPRTRSRHSVPNRHAPRRHRHDARHGRVHPAVQCGQRHPDPRTDREHEPRRQDPAARRAHSSRCAGRDGVGGHLRDLLGSHTHPVRRAFAVDCGRSHRGGDSPDPGVTGRQLRLAVVLVVPGDRGTERDRCIRRRHPSRPCSAPPTRECSGAGRHRPPARDRGGHGRRLGLRRQPHPRVPGRGGAVRAPRRGDRADRPRLLERRRDARAHPVQRGRGILPIPPPRARLLPRTVGPAAARPRLLHDQQLPAVHLHRLRRYGRSGCRRRRPPQLAHLPRHGASRRRRRRADLGPSAAPQAARHRGVADSRRRRGRPDDLGDAHRDAVVRRSRRNGVRLVLRRRCRTHQRGAAQRRVEGTRPRHPQHREHRRPGSRPRRQRGLVALGFGFFPVFIGAMAFCAVSAAFIAPIRSVR